MEPRERPQRKAANAQRGTGVLEYYNTVIPTAVGTNYILGIILYYK